MPLGAAADVQSLLDRERRRGGVGDVQEAQGAVYGIRQRRSRCLHGGQRLRPPNGAERLQAYQVPLHQRVLIRLS